MKNGVVVILTFLLTACATAPSPENTTNRISMEESVSRVTLTPIPHRKPFERESFILGQPIKSSNVEEIPFNSSEVSWIDHRGVGSVQGLATVFEDNFEPKTCAGNLVYLIPVGEYSSYRIERLYGNIIRGHSPASNQNNLPAPDPKYLSMTKTTECNSYGEFLFTDLPFGNYFVTTFVLWESDGITYGGNLMQQVKVSYKGNVNVNLENL